MNEQPKITIWYESPGEKLLPEFGGWNYLIELPNFRWLSGPYETVEAAMEDIRQFFVERVRL